MTGDPSPLQSTNCKTHNYERTSPPYQNNGFSSSRVMALTGKKHSNLENDLTIGTNKESGPERPLLNQTLNRVPSTLHGLSQTLTEFSPENIGASLKMFI
ncbi:hypothetical protein T265_12223 [Opisthorchis viverrini]|uniref:Uncharacterized protein n=1 Tax=Opisthorchis viverrini TaxID=6198 RepID=A0A074Z5N6_OPIVI|nr:hypothetical protein T265_12223 [Opisthorchis viverrini]KER18590.1 hypothetical protein T265_12223 [Opisthorchis viverrini]